MLYPDMSVSAWANRVFLPGQNSTSMGSSEAELTAFAVMASTSSPARATMTATPVANRPMVSRNRRGSRAVEAWLIAASSGRASTLSPECLVTILFDERADLLRILLNLRVVSGHQCAGHADRITEEEPLV